MAAVTGTVDPDRWAFCSKIDSAGGAAGRLPAGSGRGAARKRSAIGKLFFLISTFIKLIRHSRQIWEKQF